MTVQEQTNYRPCETITIADALRTHQFHYVATLTPYREIPVGPMFFEHALPFQFSHWGHIFFTIEGEKHISQHQAVEILEIKNCGLVAKDGVIIIKESTILDLLLQFIHTWQPDSFFRSDAGQFFIKDTRQTVETGAYFLGVYPGDVNYAHWITYTLPAWLYYREYLMELGIRLVIGRRNKFQTQALELLDIPDAMLFEMPNEIVAFESLQMMTPISMWCPSTLIANVGQSIVHLARRHSIERAMPRRIYLSRRDVDRRRLLNEAAVERMLAVHGFVSIACSEHTFAEQAIIFASADIVVGVHGAALGNILFCKPRSHVIEVFPEYCAQPHFRALADRAGLAYGFVLGTSFEPENGREASTAWDRDFVADVDVLDAAVKRAIVLGRK